MRRLLSLVVVSLAGALAPFSGFAASAKSVNANAMILLDLTAVGKQFVAVGEAGSVLHSTDEGRSWQAVASPTTRTLTAIVFVDDKIGVAVGHGGTLMRTVDGGESWQLVEADVGTDSLLGLTKLSSGTLMAYGAFGLYLESGDQGKTWTRRQILAEDFDRHISQIIEFDGRLLLVGETGTLAVSADQGQTWEARTSPYEGSFFGALCARDGALLIFGMRGNVYRSTDQGASWTQVPLATKSGFNSGSIGPDGQLILVGNNGVVASSQDNGQTFSIANAPNGQPLSRALVGADGSLIYVGAFAAGRLPARSNAATVKP